MILDVETDVETVERTCPACNQTFSGLNPESDAWFCENGSCEVLMFGPRGLSE